MRMFKLKSSSPHNVLFAVVCVMDDGRRVHVRSADITQSLTVYPTTDYMDDIPTIDNMNDIISDIMKYYDEVSPDNPDYRLITMMLL